MDSKGKAMAITSIWVAGAIMAFVATEVTSGWQFVVALAVICIAAGVTTGDMASKDQMKI